MAVKIAGISILSRNHRLSDLIRFLAIMHKIKPMHPCKDTVSHTLNLQGNWQIRIIIIITINKKSLTYILGGCMAWAHTNSQHMYTRL